MKKVRKLAAIALIATSLTVPVFGSVTAFAGSNGTTGLADVINGQEATQQQQTQQTQQTQQQQTQQQQTQQQQTQQQQTPVTQNNGNQGTTNNSTSTTNKSSGSYSGGMVNTGGLSSKDIAGYSGIAQDAEAQNTVQTTLGQVMGWIVPILVGVIFAALTARILLDILYLVAPFLRNKLAPGAMGDTMGESQMGGGMQQGMGGMGGMQGGMGGMQGGMGGMQGGMGGRRGRGGQQGGMQGGMQGAQAQGTQWVSESAIAAVMAAQQIGPNGKPNNPFTEYAKSMVVPLVLVPIMLVLLLSGVLTHVGFYFGDLISSGINSKIK